MAAPKENQFWKIRSKHGRDYLFASPQELMTAAMEYFNWVDSHPWYKVETNKTAVLKEDRLIKVPVVRPYTLSGLCIYLNASENYWHSFKKNKLSEDFLLIVAHIENVINTQQIEGAAIGAFNANIIARKQGLKEYQEVTGKDGAPLTVPPTILVVSAEDDPDLDIKESE
jgi:hypothetical protein